MLHALVPLWLALAPPSVGTPLPAFALRDPLGGLVTQVVARGKPLVVVVTTPTLEQADAQYGWDSQLRPFVRSDGPVCLWVEDMSQSWFKDRARVEMKKSYHAPPYLVLDEDGALRTAFHVDGGVTVVLVYDATGVLRRVETGAPTAEKARALWTEAQGYLK